MGNITNQFVVKGAVVVTGTTKLWGKRRVQSGELRDCYVIQNDVGNFLIFSDKVLPRIFTVEVYVQEIYVDRKTLFFDCTWDEFNM